MSAVSTQWSLLHHLNLQSHLQLAVPARFVFGNINPTGRQTLLKPSSLWGIRTADAVEGQKFSRKSQLRLPWVGRPPVKFQPVAWRVSKTVEKTFALVEEEKVIMDSKPSNRKRPSFQPKNLNLRASGVHGNTFISYVQILGTGMDTRDTSPSVLLFFDKRRIIFNAGEGLQRFCIEHKIKLSKLDHVFLTRIVSETASGVPGLLLTLANTGDTGMAVNLWGPTDLNVLVDAMRTFIPSSSVVHTHSFGTEKQDSVMGMEKCENSNSAIKADTSLLLDDEVVKVSAVLLWPDGVDAAANITEEQQMSPSDDKRECVTSTGVRFKNPRPTSPVAQKQDLSFSLAEPWELGFEPEVTPDSNGSQKRPRVEAVTVTKATVLDDLLKLEVKALPVLSKEFPSQSAGSRGPHAVAVVYICELPEIIGKFDPQKAKALGLRPGPKYGQLQAGKSVVTDNGKKTVHPSDVMDPPSPGPICLIVDCPTTSHMKSLISAPGIRRFSSKLLSGDSGESGKKVTCMIHIGPASVVNHTRYREWMTQFDGTQHLMAGHGMQTKVSPVLKSSARIMSKLNYICPQVFPIAGLKQIEDETNIGQVDSKSDLITTAENLLKFRLRPLSSSPLDRSMVPEPLDISAVQGDLINENSALQDASKLVAELWNTLPRGEESIASLNKGSSSVATSINSTVEEEITGQGSLPQDSLDDFSEDFPDCLKGVGREEMEIVFLGTGSSQPSKYRNVSSIYIHLFKRGGLLLDCGEGTYAQLKRRYGNKEADEILAGLKCVWISHIHADHHTGLVRILSVRKKVLEHANKFEPIVVVGPKQLKRYLDAYGRIEDLGMEFVDCSQTTLHAEKVASQMPKGRDELAGDVNDFASVDNSDYVGEIGNVVKSSRGLVRLSPSENPLRSHGQPVRSQLRNYWLQTGFNLTAGVDDHGRKKLRVVLSSLGLSQLTSIPVVHCPHAYGVVLVGRGKKLLQSGWRVVYSGDTRPCQALVVASKGATVLIHEATFDDAMPEEAIAKNHSLTREAIETGIAAGAYRTILTHFSQRYPKIPVFNESYNNRTCIAFDMMSVNLADLPVLPKLLPALKLLFKDEMAGEEEIEEEVVDHS